MLWKRRRELKSMEEDDIKIGRQRARGRTEPKPRVWPAEWVTESWKQI